MTQPWKWRDSDSTSGRGVGILIAVLLLAWIATTAKEGGLSVSQAAAAFATPLINDLTATAPGLSQSVAPVYGAPFVLTISGQNFDETAHVSVGGASLVTIFISSSRLTAVVPTAVLSNPGALPVIVTNADGAVSNSINLKVVERGDINANRSVNIGDALVAALTAGGIVKPALPNSVGDVNLSGSANIGDALVLALFSGRALVNLPAPAITSASPGAVSVGATLTLSGTGFSSTPANEQVLFTTSDDGVVRIIPGAATATTLTVTAPANAVSGPIQVFRLDAPIGSAEFPLLVNDTPTPLALTSVSPFNNVVPGNSVTLTGMGFDFTPSNNNVQFRASSGTVSGTVTAASAGSLTVTVPGGAQCGGVTVTAAGKTSNARTLIVSGTACPVLLTDILGGGAPGEILVLEGSGFDTSVPSNNTVTFTAVGATTVTARVLQAGGTQLHVWIPSTAVTGNVTVTVAGNTSNALLYKLPTVLQSPTLSSINPNGGPAGSSVTVTMTGTNFAAGATTVAVGGSGVTVASPVNTTSATSLTTTFAIDPAAMPGDRAVTVSTAAGASGPVQFTVNPSTAPALAIVPSSLSLATNQSGTLTVVLSPAPIDAGQIAITVASSAVVSVPDSAPFSSGQKSVSFVIFGHTPGTTNVTATLGSSSASAQINVQTLIAGAFGVSSQLVRITNLETTKAYGTGSRSVFSDIVRITNQDTTKAFGTGSRSVFSDIVRITNQDTTKAFGVGSRTVFSDLLRVTSSAGGIVTTAYSPLVSVQANPVPALSSIAPNSAAAGTGVNVTLSGTNFLRDGTVVFVSGAGITVSEVSVKSQTSLTATFTIAAGSATGPRNVTVQTVDGTSGAVTFTVN